MKTDCNSQLGVDPNVANPALGAGLQRQRVFPHDSVLGHS